MGIKPEFDGLFIDPCLPEDFGNYKVRRFFRRTLYDIQIEFDLTLGKSFYVENKKEFIGTFIPHKQYPKKKNNC